MSQFRCFLTLGLLSDTAGCQQNSLNSSFAIIGSRWVFPSYFRSAIEPSCGMLLHVVLPSVRRCLPDLFEGTSSQRLPSFHKTLSRREALVPCFCCSVSLLPASGWRLRIVISPKQTGSFCISDAVSLWWTIKRWNENRFLLPLFWRGQFVHVHLCTFISKLPNN